MNEWKDGDIVKDNQVLLRRDSIQSLFKGYHYVKNQTTFEQSPSTKGSIGNGIDL